MTEGEYSIEVDPREASPENEWRMLRALGFNRLSLGVQDFDPRVQQAINRIQPLEMTRSGNARRARAIGFPSIGVDLIYGLPHQTRRQLQPHARHDASQLAPDRLSVFGYAHMPQLFKMQRQMDAATLPSPAGEARDPELGIERLTEAGYVYIGMDHFALPSDELARAQAQRTLHRNFQGYSTRAECDLIGFGASSIGKVGDVYAQNDKDLAGYAAAIDAGTLAIARGVRLNADDRLRRDVITQLMCAVRSALRRNREARMASTSSSIVHRRAGAAASRSRRTALVIDRDGRSAVTARGRLLVRNVAMTFDRYLGQATLQRFSRTI